MIYAPPPARAVPARASAAASPPARARPRAAARRARSRAPAQASRPGSKVARRRSTSACPSCAASRTDSRSSTQVVNVGQISAYAEAGRFGVELEAPKAARGKKDDAAVVTVNAEVLASAGLISRHGQAGQGPRPGRREPEALRRRRRVQRIGAQRKIEEAGGFIQVAGAREASATKPTSAGGAASRRPETTPREPGAEGSAAPVSRAGSRDRCRAGRSSPSKTRLAEPEDVERDRGCHGSSPRPRLPTAEPEAEAATEEASRPAKRRPCRPSLASEEGAISIGMPITTTLPGQLQTHEGALASVRSTGQRLPRAGHPPAHPVRARDARRLPGAGRRAGPGGRHGRRRAT